MQDQVKGKFTLDVSGEVKPLFATVAQWNEMSSSLKKGSILVTTNEGEHEVFGILEVAKGYEGSGVATSEGIVMIFNRKEG